MAKITRRSFLSIGAAALTGVALAACSQVSPTPAGKAASEPTARATTAPSVQGGTSKAPVKMTVIMIQTSETRHKAWREIQSRFTKAHPEVTFEEVIVPWDKMMEKASTAVGGGGDLDVAQWWDDQRVPQLAANGFLIGLNQYIKRDKYELGDFFEAALQSNQWKGEQWGIPYYWDVRPFYWHKKHFEQVGLDPAKPPKNWVELRQYAEKLTKPWPIKDDIERLGFIPLTSQGTGYSLSGNSWLFIYGWMNGGEFTNADMTKVTVNDPPIVEALEWCVNWVKDFGGADRLAAFGQKAAAGGLNPFIAEAQSMMINCSACLTVPMKEQKPELLNQLGVAVPPYSKKPVTWSGVLSSNVFKSTKNPDLAWEFVKFNSSPETQLYYGETNGFLPTRKSLVDNKIFQATEELTVATKQLLPITRIRPPIPASQVLWDELVRAVDKSMTGQATPKQALDEANQKIQAELDKYLQKS